MNILEMNKNETESNKTKEKIKNYSIEWCTFSTIIGLSNLVRMKSYLIRSIWIISLLGCSAICFYLIFKMVIGYLNYDVLINIQVQKMSLANFPAVTICNLFPYDKRNAQTQSYINNVLNKNNISYVNNIAQINMNPKLVNTLIKSNIAGEENSIKRKLGFDLDYMLYSCYFNDVRCNSSDFIWRYDYDLTNCYTFNSGYDQNGNKVKIKTINEAGSDRSLKLELFLGDDVTQSQFIMNSGARIVVHNQTVYPLISSEGKDISTGFQTNIGIKSSFVSRLDAPYSDCVKKADSPDSFKSFYYKAIFNILNMTTYRKKICTRLCLQNYIKNICNCLDGSLPNIYQNNYTYCNSIDSLKCVTNARILYFNDEAASSCLDCPQECDSYQYAIFTSSSRYPTSYYLNYTVYQKNFSSILPENSSLDTFIGKSFLIANIFYDDLDYKSVTEVPALSFELLVSNIGGNLGLFIGLSVLSLMEFVEYVFQVLLFFYDEKFSNRKRAKIHDLSMNRDPIRVRNNNLFNKAFASVFNKWNKEAAIGPNNHNINLEEFHKYLNSSNSSNHDDYTI